MRQPAGSASMQSQPSTGWGQTPAVALTFPLLELDIGQLFVANLFQAHRHPDESDYSTILQVQTIPLAICFSFAISMLSKPRFHMAEFYQDSSIRCLFVAFFKAFTKTSSSLAGVNIKRNAAAMHAGTINGRCISVFFHQRSARSCGFIPRMPTLAMPQDKAGLPGY